MRPVPDCAYAFLREKEGLKLEVSADVGGTLDAGYGHADPALKPGQKITQRQADLWLKQDVNTAAVRLSKVVDEAVILALTEHQYAALVSFAFNLGVDSSWAIWKVLNKRDFDHVPEQMMRFVYCKGKKVQGLVNRRAAEVALWSTDEPGSVPDEPSSAVTRTADTPPLRAKPAFSTGHVVAGCVAAAGGVAEGAKQVTQIIQPYADKSDLVQHALSYAATAGAAAAVAVAALMWLQSRQRHS